MKTLGEALQACRIKRGKSTEDCAKACGISPHSYRRWEAETRTPNVFQLMSLADYLGVSLDVLVGRKEDLMDDLKPISQWAAYLGVSRQTLQYHHSVGNLTGVVINNCIYCTESDIDKLKIAHPGYNKRGPARKA